MDCAVRYSVAKKPSAISGKGRTINISSSGLTLTADKPVAVGDSIEVRIEWPIPLRGGCPLQLALHGHVVRAGRGQIAVETTAYEFKTLPTALRS
jgi:hypothetical protein